MSSWWSGMFVDTRGSLPEQKKVIFILVWCRLGLNFWMCFSQSVVDIWIHQCCIVHWQRTFLTSCVMSRWASAGSWQVGFLVILWYSSRDLQRSAGARLKVSASLSEQNPEWFCHLCPHTTGVWIPVGFLDAGSWCCGPFGTGVKVVFWLGQWLPLSAQMCSH